MVATDTHTLCARCLCTWGMHDNKLEEFPEYKYPQPGADVALLDCNEFAAGGPAVHPDDPD